MSENIQVKILDHNFNGTPKFLAMLTQRGHQVSDIYDLEALYDNAKYSIPSPALLTSPHTTLKRMNYMTVGIVGLSTKAVSQLRTHATRLTFVSTSTQYSSYEGREDNYVLPAGLNEAAEVSMLDAYEEIHGVYKRLIAGGMDKDKAGYLLPQGLRKALVISGSLDAWQYVLSLRLCHRNTQEVQDICKLIYKEVEDQIGPDFTWGMLPKCFNGGCPEGNFCCGNSFKKEELL